MHTNEDNSKVSKRKMHSTNELIPQAKKRKMQTNEVSGADGGGTRTEVWDHGKTLSAPGPANDSNKNIQHMELWSKVYAHNKEWGTLLQLICDGLVPARRILRKLCRGAKPAFLMKRVRHIYGVNVKSDLLLMAEAAIRLRVEWVVLKVFHKMKITCQDQLLVVLRAVNYKDQEMLLKLFRQHSMGRICMRYVVGHLKAQPSEQATWLYSLMADAGEKELALKIALEMDNALLPHFFLTNDEYLQSIFLQLNQTFQQMLPSRGLDWFTKVARSVSQLSYGLFAALSAHAGQFPLTAELLGMGIMASQFLQQQQQQTLSQNEAATQLKMLECPPEAVQLLQRLHGPTARQNYVDHSRYLFKSITVYLLDLDTAQPFLSLLENCFITGVDVEPVPAHWQEDLYTALVVAQERGKRSWVDMFFSLYWHTARPWITDPMRD